MSKLFAIIRREFIERVRTKAFVIGTLMGPVLFFAIGALPGMILGKPTASQTIAVVDATADQAAPRLLDSLSKQTLGEGESRLNRYDFVIVPADPSRAGSVRYSIIPDVDRRDERGDPAPGALTGILIITDTGLAAGRLTYLGKNVGSIGDVSNLERSLRVAVVRERMRSMGVPESVAAAATEVRLSLRRRSARLGSWLVCTPKAASRACSRWADRPELLSAPPPCGRCRWVCLS